MSAYDLELLIFGWLGETSQTTIPFIDSGSWILQAI